MHKDHKQIFLLLLTTTLKNLIEAVRPRIQTEEVPLHLNKLKTERFLLKQNVSFSLIQLPVTANVLIQIDVLRLPEAWTVLSFTLPTFDVSLCPATRINAMSTQTTLAIFYSHKLRAMTLLLTEDNFMVIHGGSKS